MLLGAERMLIAGEVRPDMVVEINNGRIAAVGDRRTLGAPERVLDGRLLIPGLVDAHVDILARACPTNDAPRLFSSVDAAGLRAIACHQFVEMLAAGITTVGAVLTVHHGPDGSPYGDPSTMADALALAARDAGIRMCLLSAVRLRGDFERQAEGWEQRAVDSSADVATERVVFSARRLAGYGDPRLSCGVTVDSLATVAVDGLIALKTRLAHLPLHVGAATDMVESRACKSLWGAGPVELLARAGVVDGCTTLVGLSELQAHDAELLADTGAVAYARTPELAGRLEKAGVTVAMPVALAGARLERVTSAGGMALAQRSGRVAAGHWADFVALDLELLGDDLPVAERLPVREVIVGGKVVVVDGQHAAAAKAAAAYADAVTRLFRA